MDPRPRPVHTPVVRPAVARGAEVAFRLGALKLPAPRLLLVLLTSHNAVAASPGSAIAATSLSAPPDPRDIQQSL